MHIIKKSILQCMFEPSVCGLYSDIISSYEYKLLKGGVEAV